MRFTLGLLVLSLVGMQLGCLDRTPPPPRVPVPQESLRNPPPPPAKPLPAPDASAQTPQPLYDDPPIVAQRPPEQPAFLEAYRRVGEPRLVLFVNRTLEGQILPARSADPLLSVEHRRRSSTNPVLEQDTVDVYLRPGEYDEANARAIDYQAIEAILSDHLSGGGRVVLVSPAVARQRLSDQQVRELQEGRPQVMREIAGQLDADVLIQVQARPTRQTAQGLHTRLVAEALNIKGGESLGRAVVDVPPPLDKVQINKYTRYLARKLMDDMTVTWMAPPSTLPTRPTAP